MTNGSQVALRKDAAMTKLMGADDCIEIDDSGKTIVDRECVDDASQEMNADTDATETRQDRRRWWRIPRSRRLTRIVTRFLLPMLLVLLGVCAGYLKWQDTTTRDAQTAGAQAVQAAKDTAIAMLTYKPDTVDADLTAPRARLVGKFRDSYTSLTNDVVIPGAKKEKVSAVATVPAAAVVAASADHAVVLVFVNQVTVVGAQAPTDTASRVKVTLEKVGDQWLVSDFLPI